MKKVVISVLLGAFACGALAFGANAQMDMHGDKSMNMDKKEMHMDKKSMDKKDMHMHKSMEHKKMHEKKSMSKKEIHMDKKSMDKKDMHKSM
ncbi:hypothetical protein [Helicobacter sp. 11S02629-2]|uniref:hypothetical protein n=1 Tax=Helicobacter sp. 11S02629-2 TaxID=1476195 RepID=UPI000BA75532|nr:hypothetical protein [Helicobacter sp. 11S02629-2]PAF45482.1 hypothetical protein BKH40_03195 [Helicobacter sp. 11S02629-2]